MRPAYSSSSLFARYQACEGASRSGANQTGQCQPNRQQRCQSNRAVPTKSAGVSHQGRIPLFWHLFSGNIRDLLITRCGSVLYLTTLPFSLRVLQGHTLIDRPVCVCLLLVLQTNWNCWDDTDSVNNNGTLPAASQSSRRCLPSTPALPNLYQKFCNGTSPGGGGQFNDFNYALIGMQGIPGDGGE